MQEELEFFAEQSRLAWRILTKECRARGTLVPTSSSLDSAIERIIDDIENNLDVGDFLTLVDPFIISRSDGRGCSRMFLDFLMELRRNMALQGVLDVSPLQAMLLLYDHDLANGGIQNALRPFQEAPGIQSFISTFSAEVRFKCQVRLILPMTVSSGEWSKLPSIDVHRSWTIVTRRDLPFQTPAAPDAEVG